MASRILLVVLVLVVLAVIGVAVWLAMQPAGGTQPTPVRALSLMPQGVSSAGFTATPAGVVTVAAPSGISTTSGGYTATPTGYYSRMRDEAVAAAGAGVGEGFIGLLR